VPTAAALRDGGYETKTFLYRKYAAPYAEAMERTLINGALALVSRAGR